MKTIESKDVFSPLFHTLQNLGLEPGLAAQKATTLADRAFDLANDRTNQHLGNDIFYASLPARLS